MKRLPRVAPAVGACLVSLVLVAGAVWGWWWLRKLGEQRQEGLVNGVETMQSGPPFIRCQYTAPDGTRYWVETSGAAYRLAMRPEDGHSGRVFPTYAAAMRYARVHRLASIPSTPMILATCAAADTRFQVALELALDAHPEFGRRALLQEWLIAVERLRARALSAARPACDHAAGYLAEAIGLQGGDPGLPTGLAVPVVEPPANDPPLGSWADLPELAQVWHRDRFLAKGVWISDDLSAGAVAVLALTQPAGWERQAAVARALHGKPSVLTFESLAPVLAGFSDNPADPAAAAIVRQFVPAGEFFLAPAALSFAASPEEKILAPLGMAAWDDPVGALIAAVRDGSVSLVPGPDAGFYRRRWFALETLAAPDRALEAFKLQLTPDYTRRWQRAFAAGFTEGRSGFVKRLPTIALGSSPEGPLPLRIAPRFTAEPTPAVYLRLARAYRTLAGELDAAAGTDWPALRQTADALRPVAERLLGLAAIVYREVGVRAPLAADEAVAGAEMAASSWLANLADDPGITADARTLVTLVSDFAGGIRAPAVLGVRLEPVEYDWLEKPTVSEEIAPEFVPARLWLASPVTATVNVKAIPAPVDFRRQCDAHSAVEPLCAAFGAEPPRIFTAAPRRWPWILGALVMLGGVWAACDWWFQRRWRTRLLAAAAVALGCAGALAIAWFHPPLWLVRWSLVRAAQAPDGLAAAASYRMHDWMERWRPAQRGAVFFALLRDPEPQVRYGAAITSGIFVSGWEFPEPTEKERTALRHHVNDSVPEVGWAAWRLLAKIPTERAFLLEELNRSTTGFNADMRLMALQLHYHDDPETTAAMLKLVHHPDQDIRASALRGLPIHQEREQSLEIIRAAACDSSPQVRATAARKLASHGAADDIPRLVDMWQDPSELVRKTAWSAIIRHRDRTAKPGAPAEFAWTDAMIQQSVIRYAANPEATLGERLAAFLRIAEPLEIRAAARRLLPETASLPDLPPATTPRMRTRNGARGVLVFRWLLAAHQPEHREDMARRPRSSGLENHPELLAQLDHAIQGGADPAAALAIIREAAAAPGRTGRFAASLHEQITANPGRGLQE